MHVNSSNRFLAGAAMLAGLVLVLPATARAQMGFVVEANYADDADLGVGGGITFGLGSLTARHGIRGEATFDYYFPGDNFNYWEANGNLLLDIKSVAGLYVGASVNYGHSSFDFNDEFDDACDVAGVDCDASDSNIGLNLLGGYNFPAGGKFAPFVQAKIEVGDGSQFVATGGFRF